MFMMGMGRNLGVMRGIVISKDTLTITHIRVSIVDFNGVALFGADYLLRNTWLCGVQTRLSLTKVNC